VQGERQFAAEDVLVQPVETAADDGAELVDRRAEVAAGEQFFVEPALLSPTAHREAETAKAHRG